jgi:hypothetical protein
MMSSWRFAREEASVAVAAKGHALKCGMQAFSFPRTTDARLHRVSRLMCGIAEIVGVASIRSMIRHELQARAVEMLACQQYGIPYEPEKWAMWCAMETVKTYRIDVGSIADLVDAIRTVAKQSETLALLDRVLSVPLSSRARQEAA